MILKYSYENEYLGKDEVHEEAYFNFVDYDYEVDVSFEDIEEFFEKENDKLDTDTLKYLFENDFFDDIDEDGKFYDFMYDKYRNEAYLKYKEENEE